MTKKRKRVRFIEDGISELICREMAQTKMPQKLTVNEPQVNEDTLGKYPSRENDSENNVNESMPQQDYGNPSPMMANQNDSESVTRTVESFQWLINTHHRDLGDQLMYKTTKIYTTRHKGEQYIVADRLLLLPNNKYTLLGDTKCIHARDIEEYTLAFEKYTNEANSIAITSQDESLSTENMQFIQTLPPSQDQMKEFILTTGTIVLPDIKLPKTHRMAMKSAEAEQWRIAEQSEIGSMITHKVFTQMVLPPGKQMIETKWVYVLKYKNGTISKYKARLVAKGYEQVYGIDYEETYAPVAKLTSLRLVLAISALLNLDIQQMDVETAFLNAELKEEVYISIPDGVQVAAGCNCLRLNKALYGLKQSPREWYQNINGFLQSMGFKRLQAEHCLYFYKDLNDICLISLYVDDLIIAGSTTQVTTRIKECLSRRYSMKDLGNIDDILGCKVSVNHLQGTVSIHQQKYLTGILSKYLDPHLSWLDTPADSRIVLTQEHGPTTQEEKENMKTKPYRELVGSLLWLSLGTRPDIAYAVSQIAKFNANPGPLHWQAVIRILRYLNGTQNLGLIYHKQNNDTLQTVTTSISSADIMIPTAFVDADYARDTDSRRSVTGFLFFLAGAPISWQTRQQPSVALSTMESEFMAACAAAQESVWLLQLLQELSCTFLSPMIIFEDNKACIDYTKNPSNHQRTKHISVRYHFIRDLVAQQLLTLKPIASEDNLADIMTKPLDKKPFHRLMGKFMAIIE